MNLDQARFNMIEQQVRPWSVLDRTVLQTMFDIPRDHFVPESMKAFSYSDIEVPLNHGEVMMHPRVEGRMLQELEIDVDDECLEIGTGSGFVTACMATMAKHIDSIDIHDDFLDMAATKLNEINISNITLNHKDALTLDSQKKYDVIAVTGSLPDYLPFFETLLKPNGRLFVVIGSSKKLMHAIKVTHTDNEFIRSNLFETNLNPLVGVTEKSAFSF